MSVAAAGVPGIDSARLAAWLAGPLPELEPPLGFVRIGEGQSNLTFRVEDVAGHVVVVRRPPLGERLASAHDMSREYRILSCLAPAGAPVPRPFGFCDDPSVADAPFYAMEHVDGIVLNRVDAAERLTTAERRLAARSMASTSPRSGSATSAVPRALPVASCAGGRSSGMPRRRESCR
jgi:aminoglycoside phosphotransferase (APT) family kinase protein